MTAWDPRIQGLHGQRPFASGDSSGRSFDPLNEIGRPSIQTFEVKSIVGEAGRMPLSLIEIGAGFGKIQVERPCGVFKVVKDFDDLLTGSRYDLSLGGHDQMGKCKRKDNRYRQTHLHVRHPVPQNPSQFIAGATNRARPRIFTKISSWFSLRFMLDSNFSGWVSFDGCSGWKPFVSLGFRPRSTGVSDMIPALVQSIPQQPDAPAQTSLMRICGISDLTSSQFLSSDVT